MDAATSMAPGLQFGSRCPRCQNPLHGDVLVRFEFGPEFCDKVLVSFVKSGIFEKIPSPIKRMLYIKNISRKTNRENPEKNCQGR